MIYPSSLFIFFSFNKLTTIIIQNKNKNSHLNQRGVTLCVQFHTCMMPRKGGGGDPWGSMLCLKPSLSSPYSLRLCNIDIVCLCVCVGGSLGDATGCDVTAVLNSQEMSPHSHWSAQQWVGIGCAHALAPRRTIISGRVGLMWLHQSAWNWPSLIDSIHYKKALF